MHGVAGLGTQHPKHALDAGVGGVIVPMIESAEQLREVRSYCCWPPAGRRGVGFSRANLFGKRFDAYREEAQAPLLVAMIENMFSAFVFALIVASDGLVVLIWTR